MGGDLPPQPLVLSLVSVGGANHSNRVWVLQGPFNENRCGTGHATKGLKAQDAFSAPSHEDPGHR